METSTKVGKIYAGAIYQIAREKNIIGKVHDELLELDKTYRDNSEFRKFFASPKIQRRHKIESLKKLFAGKLDALTLNLLYVLVEKGRESALDNIVAAFVRFRDEAENRVHAYVTSAAPLADDQRQKLLASLTTGNVKVVLHERVDASLIGGVVVRVKDFAVDNTIRTRLREMTDRLAPYKRFRP